MTDPLLSWQVMKAAKEAAGRPGRDLFARINALSLFRIRDVPVSDQPSFSPNLSLEAYERAHDYLQLGMTHLYSMSPDRSTDVILETAGELLEKLYLDVPKETPERARELYNASLAYYLSGHYARAYVIMKGLGSLPGTSQTAALLRMMFLKDLPGMRQATTELLTNPEYSDAELEQSLLQGEITVGEATERIMQVTLNRAFSMFLEYARSGQGELIEKACALLETGIRIAIDQELFEWWWLLYCSVALLREYKRGSLWKQLQQMLDEDQSGTVQAFIQGCFYQPNPIIELWRSQANAVPFINDPLLDAGGRSSYCVKMPTSAGKTRIAEIAILRFLVDCAEEPERKCLYIAPYRALAAEVESNLKRSFDPLGIRTSELYGGFFIDPTEAQMFDKTRILVATPEKTDAFLRHNDKLAKEVGLVIIDEGHIIDSGTRGLRYEFFLHRLVRRFADRGTRLIFISAVMPKVEQFTVWITNRKPDDGLITSNWRASRLMLGVLTWDGRAGRVDYLYQGLQKINVPMFFGSFMSALVTQQALAVDGFRRLETERGVFPTWGNRSEIVALAGVESVLKEGPTLIFASQPDFVDSIAQSVLTALALGSSLFCWNLDSARLPGRVDPEALQMLQNCIRMAGEMTGSNSLVVKALKAGFIVHHGGIPKLLRTQLECLARAGVVRLTIATNTLAQGVNLPVRIILIHSLAQGAKRYVPATDFWNICGRAGRAMHENEGAVFILADETSPSPANFVTAKAQAQWLLKKYVREGQSQTLVSAIRHFLEQVVHAWQKEYPEADVGELCQHLADDKVDWLPENERHQLEVLDAQLLALLEETENAETTPEFVEKLLERSLLLIQLNQAELGEPLTTRRAVGILTARIQHVSSSVPASQLRQYYRTGLTLSDCHFLKRHLTEIKQAVLEACHFMEWSPQQRSDYLASFCQEYLMKLSDIRPESITSLPACWPRIVKKWLLGETSEEIARDPEVAQGVKGTMQVSTVIDDLCDYRLPWGFNALHSFLAMESAALEDWLEVTELPVASFYFSSMVRYGVPSPVATILLAMGMESRRAAIVCADRYPGTILPSSVLDWASSLTESEVCGWDLGSSLCDTVLKFGASLGQQRQVSTESKIRFTISIPNQAYVSPFADGTPLIAQARPPNGIVFYSSAVERLGMVTSNDPEVFRQVEVGQMTAVVSGDVGESHDAWRELEVVLVSVGRQAVVLDEVRTVPA